MLNVKSSPSSAGHAFGVILAFGVNDWVHGASQYKLSRERFQWSKILPFKVRVIWRRVLFQCPDWDFVFNRNPKPDGCKKNKTKKKNPGGVDTRALPSSFFTSSTLI